MRVPKYSKYQIHKESFETLSENPNNRSGAPLGFSNIHCRKTSKKLKGGSFGVTFRKKSRTMPKKTEPL